MVSLPSNLPETVLPSAGDTQLAKESSRKLAKVLGSPKANVRVQIQSEGDGEETLDIPFSAVRLLSEILTQMAEVRAVALQSVRADLTTQQAADLLNVSRPCLIELLEKGAIPFRKVGTHRRVLLDDVMAYKRKFDEERLQTLEELSALDQELGLG